VDIKIPPLDQVSTAQGLCGALYQPLFSTFFSVCIMAVKLNSIMNSSRQIWNGMTKDGCLIAAILIENRTARLQTNRI
jgi:hypothetical protein